MKIEINIKKILPMLLIIVLMSSIVYAVVVPRGDSVQIRDTNNWDTYTDNTYLINQNPDPCEPGGFVEIRFKIENVGGDYAKDLVFEIVPRYPFSIFPGESTIKKIGDLHMSQVGDEAYMVYYKLRVDKDAVEGNNPIKIRYSTNGGLVYSSKEFDVRIQTNDAILNINSVETNPKEIYQGQKSTLTINLENMADSLLKNVKVNLEVYSSVVTTTSIITSELPFTPLGSTNEKIIENIDAGESVNVTFDLIADADAVSKIYKLPIKIEYSDELAKNYSKTYYTSVIVGSPPDLISSVDSSEIIVPKSGGIVSIKFTNKGSSDVKFLYVELMQNSNYEIISSAGIYVGNIDSDDYETADFKIFVKSDDTNIQLPLKLEYKDANNKEFVSNEIINLKLYSSKTAKKYGLIAESSSSKIFIFIVLGVGGFFLYRRWKKKKKTKEKLK
jgi:hypothetical protein